MTINELKNRVIQLEGMQETATQKEEALSEQIRILNTQIAQANELKQGVEEKYQVAQANFQKALSKVNFLSEEVKKGNTII